MSGIFRNLFTLIQALFAGGAIDPRSKLTVHFLITPFDTGIRVLKSDKYLQLAESAQLDFMIRTRLIGKLLSEQLRFVNAAQLIKFSKPIGIFKRVRVETEIIYADQKCAYFSHVLFIGAARHGEVLVKMKFKKGALTAPADALLGTRFAAKPASLQRWDEALEAM